MSWYIISKTQSHHLNFVFYRRHTYHHFILKTHRDNHRWTIKTLKLVILSRLCVGAVPLTKPRSLSLPLTTKVSS